MGERANGALKRRGLLAGAAVLAGAGLAKLGGAGRAEAAHDTGGTPEALHAEVRNTTVGFTGIERTNNTTFLSAFYVTNTLGAAIQATSANGEGVWGQATGGGRAGVLGTGGNPAGSGVIGVLAGATVPGPNVGCGVYGSGLGVGGFGVFGDTNSDTKAGTTGRNQGNGPGVRGVSSSSALTAAGVKGECPRYGVWGATPSGVGVFAQSTNGGIGLYAATTQGGYAGLFEGRLHVNGDITIAGGAKSAAVELPNGELARMYCQEAPEPWFEDFGAGQLVGGKATVAPDKEFAAVVKADDYAVFPVPEGDCAGLYVAAKTAAGFDVREVKGGTSSVPFRYRVVARRKDLQRPRLERVARPKKPEAGEVRPPTGPESPRPGRDAEP